MVEIKYVPTICPYCGTGCGLSFVVKTENCWCRTFKRHPETRVSMSKETLDTNLLAGKTD